MFLLFETSLLQVNASNKYYTTGEHNILFIKLGSNKLLRLDHTYYMNRTIFQNYTITENTVNEYDLEFSLNATSNEYTLQSFYNANSFIGVIGDLSQLSLAIYDTTISPYSYTGSEHIDITDNRISLISTIKVNDEVVMHHRSGGVYLKCMLGLQAWLFYKTLMMGLNR